MKKFIVFLLLIIGLCTVYEFTREEKSYYFSDAGIVYGNPNASNKLVIFTSLQCEKCEKFSKNVSGTIKDMIQSNEYCIVIKPTNKTFYQIDNCMSLKYEELESYYNKPVNPKEISKENAGILETIETEMNDNSINAIPIFFYNGKKYSVDSDEEFKEIVFEK